MFDWNIAGAASDILGGLFQTGYNLYTNKRDFDYQKALQQQIFEREDTAVQRRMADLEAAGLNPNLAAGSAAGAGQAVSRSTTNDINIGSALDAVQAVNQIKLQKQETKNLQRQYDIINSDALSKHYERQLNLASTFYQLGIPFQTRLQEFNGKNYIQVEPDTFRDGEWIFHGQGSPLQNAFDYQIKNSKNSADILQKQNNWFTANQILGAASDLASSVGLFTPKFTKRLK